MLTINTRCASRRPLRVSTTGNAFKLAWLRQCSRIATGGTIAATTLGGQPRCFGFGIGVGVGCPLGCRKGVCQCRTCSNNMHGPRHCDISMTQHCNFSPYPTPLTGDAACSHPQCKHMCTCACGTNSCSSSAASVRCLGWIHTPALPPELGRAVLCWGTAVCCTAARFPWAVPWGGR